MIKALFVALFAAFFGSHLMTVVPIIDGNATGLVLFCGGLLGLKGFSVSVSPGVLADPTGLTVSIILGIVLALLF